MPQENSSASNFVISCDDGCASDYRLADLAKKYNTECIFYWPVEWQSYAYFKGYIPLPYSHAKEIAYEFEIGSHTITHPLLTQIPFDHAIYEIVDSKKILEQIFGKQVTKFSPPRGYSNKQLDKVIKGTYEESRLTRGKNLVHIHPDSGANNNKPWLSAISKETKELWCHSWELDKYNLWQELEAFLEGASS